MEMKKIMIINGPNLNILGIREKDIYGNDDYESICSYIKDKFSDKKVRIDILQSNSEGKIIDFLQSAYFRNFDGIVINPGAYTHYSYAIFDAIKSILIPTVEVHLSNIHERKTSVTAPACIAQIYGKGKEGYVEAVELLINEKTKWLI